VFIVSIHFISELNRFTDLCLSAGIKRRAIAKRVGGAKEKEKLKSIFKYIRMTFKQCIISKTDVIMRRKYLLSYYRRLSTLLYVNIN